MSTSVINTPNAPAPVTLVPRNDVNLLRGVSWEQYRAFRDDPANNGVRMYYSDGVLLQMTVSYLHERIRTLISLLVWDWLETQDVPVLNAGQWTMRREINQRGLEPDNCFYVRRLSQVEGKSEIDLSVDPPPDLAIEVDITTASALKFAIYASLQIPEIWVWEKSAIHVYRLQGADYAACEESDEILGFPLTIAGRVILEHYAKNDLAVKRAFREQLEA